MLRTIWNRQSTYRTQLKVLLAASLISIIPVIVLGFITYFIASSSIMQGISKTNKETMRQVQERIDKLLVTNDKIVLQQAFNPTLTDFLKEPDPLDNIQSLKNVTTILNTMEMLIDNVDSVYLYMNRQQLAINPSQGIVEAPKLGAELLQRINESKEPFFWYEHNTTRSELNGGSHVITLVRRLPVSSDQALGYLIINLNEQAIFNVFGSLYAGTNGEMLILTPSGSVLSDWHKPLNRELLSHHSIRDLMASDIPESSDKIKINGDSMLVSSLESDYNGWRYVSILSLRELTKPIQSIKYTTTIICLALILMGLFASILLSKRLFRIISGIAESIRVIGKFNPTSQRKMDEFGLIHYYVETIRSENDELENQIKESMPLLRANFIQRLLTEPFRSGEFYEKLNYYQIPVKCPFYTVLCIELDNLRGQSEQDVNLFFYGAINIVKEIISHYTNGMVVRMQSDQIAVVINYGLESDEPSLLQAEIFRISEEIRTLIEQVLKVTATIGVGHSYLGLENIQRSYKEAVEALKYQLLEGTGTVLFIEQVNPEATTLTYPVEQEQSVLTNLRLGNIEQASSAVDDFAVSLKMKGSLTTDHVRQSFVQLVAATMRTLYELDPKEGPTLFEENVYQTVNGFKTMEHVVQWLKKVMFPTIITHIRHLRSERNSLIADKVLRYIHEHYDEDLSQPFLAEMVMMPVSHFSSIFKQEVGVTFTDYVIAFRIDKAKELLAQTDLKVTDIADRLRYNNSQNFIRAFKRLTGVTPGEYRSKHVKTLQQ
ncbi:helix-turn-helix domain-containing protein [Paenibacillus sp. LMG 31460]|uniref:Helix-turn-helix domain-containing protein n=1 Tax=Paenibacillus germinis TaxID=2654979 RepID=A0ABX1Z6D3_9BACL|nr:helix-turn-helix domain-containing protein [Paenibacillus germinis]NOU87894.1 helix-turn-helix domain-containing protein [Paenibacillus germinis]